MRAEESSALFFTRALARGRGLHILEDVVRRSLSLPSFSSLFCLPLENISIHLSAYYQIILCMNIGIKFAEIPSSFLPMKNVSIHQSTYYQIFCEWIYEI